MNRGWTIHAGPFLTLALCLAGCGQQTGTGTGTAIPDSGGPTCLVAETVASGISTPIHDSGASPRPAEKWWKFTGSAGIWRLTVVTEVTTGGTEVYTVHQGTCAGLVQKASFSTGLPGTVCQDFVLGSGDAWVFYQSFASSEVVASFIVEPGACP